MFKLSGPESEITRRNLVAERFSDLADAKRNLFARSSLHIFKIDKNALRCFRSEIQGIFAVLGYALKRSKHQVKLADIGKVMLAAGRAGNVMGIDILLHFLIRPGVNRLFNR